MFNFKTKECFQESYILDLGWMKGIGFLFRCWLGCWFFFFFSHRHVFFLVFSIRNDHVWPDFTYKSKKDKAKLYEEQRTKNCNDTRKELRKTNLKFKTLIAQITKWISLKIGGCYVFFDMAFIIMIQFRTTQSERENFETHHRIIW